MTSKLLRWQPIELIDRVCNWCNKTIPAKEVYTENVGFVNDVPVNNYYHYECALEYSQTQRGSS